MRIEVFAQNLCCFSSKISEKSENFEITKFSQVHIFVTKKEVTASERKFLQHLLSIDWTQNLRIGRVIPVL